MDEAGPSGVGQASAHGDARRERMRTPDEVVAMLALKQRGRGVKGSHRCEPSTLTSADRHGGL